MKNFIKFCAVGAVNTLVTFCVFYILSEILGVNYLISSFLGYAAGVMNSFVLNKGWTFRDKNKKVFIQFTKFAFLNIISLGANLVLMFICVEKIYVSKTFSQIIATCVTIVINYIGSRILVFSVNNSDIEESALDIVPELQEND